MRFVPVVLIPLRFFIFLVLPFLIVYWMFLGLAWGIRKLTGPRAASR